MWGETGRVAGAIERGRESFAAQAWTDACEQLSAADSATPLAAADLELLAQAAYLVGLDELILLSSAALAETTLRLLSSFVTNSAEVVLIESIYIKNVAQASKGEIKIQRSGPEVVPSFEQLEPVSNAAASFVFGSQTR